MSALSALGVAPENPAFPAVLNCPICHQNTLHLFDDLATDGIWLRCAKCGAHGDIITFAASIWNTSLPDVIDKFVDLRLINKTEKSAAEAEYSRALRKQTALQHFWADVETQLWNHDDDIVACRLRELGVKHEINPRNLIGVAHPDQIAALCVELGRPKPKQVRNRGVSIVFPFYDLPGRFTGVLLTQYSEEFAARNNFIPATGFKRRRPEAGYFLLDTVFVPAPDSLKNTQFVLDNANWVLQLQCDQLKRGLPLLPIVAGYTGTEANSYGRSWTAFPALTRLFQASAISPELVSRAATARGYICVTTPLHEKTRERDNPIKQLGHIRHAATTWQTSLTATLGQMSEIAAQSFAARLTISPDKLTPCLKRVGERFSTGFADRVLAQAILAAPLGSLQVAKNRTIVVRADGWWNSANCRVCSANVVISKIIQADNGERTYSGTIYVDGEQFEFADNAKRIERMGLLAYAQAFVAPKKKLIVFDNTWNKRSHLISIELNKPELVHVSSRLGWDEHASVFRFADFEITSDGTVTTTALPAPKKQRSLFPSPTPVAPPSIKQFLTPSPENAFVWSVFACVAADLAAPILRRDPVATGLTGAAFESAVRIGTALGCDSVYSTSLQRSYVSRHLSVTAENADWPIFAFSTFDDTSYGTVLPRCHTQPLFVKLSQPAAAIAPSYGWQVITGTPPPVTTDFTVLKHVLPAYIQRMLRQRMSLAAQTPNTAHAILRDLHVWQQETYGASFQPDYATNQLLTAAQAHASFFNELGRAVENGRLNVLPHPRNKAQAANYLVRKKDYWWLNQRAIDRYFYSNKTVVPNWLLIKELLIQSGAFIAEELMRGTPGIIVDVQWGDQFLLHSDEARETG